MTTFAKSSSVFMFYREQSNQNVIGPQTFFSLWSVRVFLASPCNFQAVLSPTWGMRNQMTWNLLIIVQVDKVSSIFKFLSQEEKQKSCGKLFER